MFADTNERAGVEERYETACNASSMKVEAEKGGAGDVMIAAGWSPVGVGGALMRLHSEFSRPARNGGKTDAILLLTRLKSLPAAVAAMGSVASCWGMEDGFRKALAVVVWWLDHVCQKCSGRKMQMIPGTPSLSARSCPTCKGSGEALLPHGAEGRRLATYMDSCVADWQGSMKKNLANKRRARNKVVDTGNGRVIIAAGDGTGC